MLGIDSIEDLFDKGERCFIDDTAYSNREEFVKAYNTTKFADCYYRSDLCE